MTETPIGTFFAVRTRDGEALSRDGETIYAVNRLGHVGTTLLFEVRFGDGLWMLATGEDLDLARG